MTNKIELNENQLNNVTGGVDDESAWPFKKGTRVSFRHITFGGGGYMATGTVIECYRYGSSWKVKIQEDNAGIQDKYADTVTAI